MVKMKLRLPAPGEPITVVLKLAGEACNINCHYCYEKRKPSSGIHRLQPTLLARFLDMCHSRPLHVVLHGGEPLLIGQRRMRDILNTLARYRGPIQLGIQTNGLLLSRAWLDLFAELWPEIDIALSLDGPESANAFRVDYRNRAVYPGIIRAITLLADRGIRIGAAMTVTSLALGSEEECLATFARFPNICHVALSPCLDINVPEQPVPADPLPPHAIPVNAPFRSVAGVAPWATSPQQYAEFVYSAFRIWRDKGYFNQFLLDPVHAVMTQLTGVGSLVTAWSEYKEPFIVALYPDGTLGTSDEMSMPGGRLGTVDDSADLDDLLRWQQNPQQLRQMTELLETCDGCSHRSVCAGGSLADRLRLAGTSWEGEYCDARRWLIDSIGAAVK